MSLTRKQRVQHGLDVSVVVRTRHFPDLKRQSDLRVAENALATAVNLPVEVFEFLLMTLAEILKIHTQDSQLCDTRLVLGDSKPLRCNVVVEHAPSICQGPNGLNRFPCQFLKCIDLGSNAFR